MAAENIKINLAVMVIHRIMYVDIQGQIILRYSLYGVTTLKVLNNPFATVAVVNSASVN